MAFHDTADFDDEEFGFHYKRIIRPPLSSLTNPTSNTYHDGSSLFDNRTNRKVNDEYDGKPTTTRISKGKGVIIEKRLRRHSPEHSNNTLALSPVSPFTSPETRQYHTQQQQQQQERSSRSYINVNTLSPEITGPQNAISPHKTASTLNANDTRMTSISVISDDSFTGKDKGKVKVPPNSVPASEYYTVIDPDLPQEEKIRQLTLMLLQRNLDQKFFVLDLSGNGDNDEAVQEELTRKTNMQWVLQQMIEKLSSSNVNPFDIRSNRLIKDSEYIYAEPNPDNERHRKKLESCKRLYAALKKESKDRQRAIYDVYEYSAKAEDLREAKFSGDRINLGSCHDYIPLMDDEQQAFISEYQQWKDSIRERLCATDDDTTTSTSSTSPIALQDLILRKSKMVSALRQQLHMANERQLEAGQVGDRILADIRVMLKKKTLFFPRLDLPLPSSASSASSSPSPLSSLSSPLSTTTATSSDGEMTDTKNQIAQRIKKRRVMGLEDDIEMYGRPTFELLRNLTKLK